MNFVSAGTKRFAAGCFQKTTLLSVTSAQTSITLPLALDKPEPTEIDFT